MTPRPNPSTLAGDLRKAVAVAREIRDFFGRLERILAGDRPESPPETRDREELRHD
jgi:hypothetical protein